MSEILVKLYLICKYYLNITFLLISSIKRLLNFADVHICFSFSFKTVLLILWLLFYFCTLFIKKIIFLKKRMLSKLFLILLWLYTILLVIQHHTVSCFQYLTCRYVVTRNRKRVHCFTWTRNTMGYRISVYVCFKNKISCQQDLSDECCTEFNIYYFILYLF